MYTTGLRDEAPAMEQVVLPALNVDVHVRGEYCGESIDAESGGGLPADVFVYRFILEIEIFGLLGGSCCGADPLGGIAGVTFGRTSALRTAMFGSASPVGVLEPNGSRPRAS